jgi:hypothetical protein
MNGTPGQFSPRSLARLGGLLYLIIIVIGVWEEMFVRSKVIVSGDATATMSNLRAMESLWRQGIAGELFLLACAITLTLIFFVLFRPVSPRLAMLTVMMNLVSISVEVVAALGLVAALFTTGHSAYLVAFTPQQVDALVTLCIRWHGQGFGVALLFFGFVCLIEGHLIRKSGFVPAAIGAGMQIAGACYLINSFALIVAPHTANVMFPWILIPCFLGELAFCVWLLVKGVDEGKWWVRAEQCGPI